MQQLPLVVARYVHRCLCAAKPCSLYSNQPPNHTDLLEMGIPVSSGRALVVKGYSSQEKFHRQLAVKLARLQAMLPWKDQFLRNGTEHVRHSFRFCYFWHFSGVLTQQARSRSVSCVSPSRLC